MSGFIFFFLNPVEKDNVEDWGGFLNMANRTFIYQKRHPDSVCYITGLTSEILGKRRVAGR